jgi:hypothetical protein
MLSIALSEAMAYWTPFASPPASHDITAKREQSSAPAS